MAYYHHESQAMADLLPANFRMRLDPFSVGQQFLTGAAIHLEHLREQIQHFSDGHFLSTAPLNTLDVVYTVFLGADFQFQPDLSDPRRVSYRVPFIRGLHQGKIYPVTVVPSNNLEGLEKALPTRIGSDKTITLGPEVLPPTPVAALGTASLQPLSVPGYIYITLQGASQRGVFHRGQLFLAQVYLRGITTKGTVEEETLEFPANLTMRSRHRYKELLGVQARYIVPETATIAVSGAEHHFAAHLDQELVLPVNRQEQYVIWTLEDGILTSSYTALAGEKEVILQPHLRWQLVDDTGEPLIEEADFTLVPRRPWLAVLYQNRLLFYHKLLEYPPLERLELLTRRTDGCLLTIEADRFCYLPGETLEVRALATAKARQILRYRWEVAPPGGPWEIYRPDASLQLVPLPPGDTPWLSGLDGPAPVYYHLPLDQPGWWGIALTATYADGSTSTDVRLVGALQKAPMTSFDLTDVITDADRIFADSDERLWVAADTEAKRLVLITDAALVDYDNKLIFLKESYDAIEVIP